MVKGLLIALVLTTTSTFLYAQQQISGRVLDENGEALTGVSVIIKGTTRGTATDIDGMFTLEADQEDILVFSFIGYKSEEISVGSQTQINIQLQEDTEELSEVVVIGYGSTKKVNLTTAVSSIKAEEISSVPVASLDQAIQGRVAGVQVTKATGAPGGGISIRIRGNNSINGGQEPLYVVDGVPINNSFTQSASQGGANGGYAGNEVINGLAGLNTDDIQSIEILTDAAAASIYGSRGANGVVLITTKQGKSGKPTVSISAYAGVAVTQGRYDLLNGQQYAGAVNEGLIRSGNPDNVIITGAPYNTDWQDEIFQPAPVYNATLGIGGGSETTQYYISVGAFSQDGTIINSKFDRLSFRANVDHKFSKKFSVGTRATVSYTNSNRLRNSGGYNVQDAFNGNSTYGASVLSSALVMSPLVPVRDPITGLYATDTLNAIQNPVAIANLNNLYNKGLRLIANIYFDWKLTNNLSFYTSVGGDLRDENETFNSIPPQFGGGGSVVKRSFREDLIEIRSYLTYDLNFGENNNINVVAGTSFQNSTNDGYSIGTLDLVSSQINTLAGGTAFTAPGVDLDNGYKIFSVYSRVQGSFLDRYLFSATARVDGSSRFGPNNRYGFFPSVSAGWRISEEAFFRSSLINELKLRTSYGTTGNDRIPSYRYIATMTTIANNYIGRNGLIFQNVANPNYSWEETQEFNIGTDIAFMENRFEFTANWYRKTTVDLLLARDLPAVSGVEGQFNPFVNIGSIRNTGFEFSLTGTIINKNRLKWESNFNISFNQNKVLSLVDGDITAGSYGYANVARVGEEISFQLYQLEETVDPSNGYQRIKDLNGDGIITDADLQIVASPLPDHFGGFQNTVTYGNFELGMLLQWVSGNSIINGTRGFIEDTGRPSIARTGLNMSAEALNRWQEEGDVTAFPRIDYAKPGFDNTSPFNLGKPTDANLEDGSFLKIRNITLAYNLPKPLLERLNLKYAKVGLNAFNVFTLTEYTGYDPEVNHNVTANVGIGYDEGTYPQPTIYTVTLNVGF